MPHRIPSAAPALQRVSAILEACRGAGRRAPAVGSGHLRPAWIKTRTCDLAIIRARRRAVPGHDVIVGFRLLLAEVT